jgi:hypothetical protein
MHIFISRRKGSTIPYQQSPPIQSWYSNINMWVTIMLWIRRISFGIIIAYRNKGQAFIDETAVVGCKETIKEALKCR